MSKLVFLLLLLVLVAGCTALQQPSDKLSTLVNSITVLDWHPSQINGWQVAIAHYPFLIALSNHSIGMTVCLKEHTSTKRTYNDNQELIHTEYIYSDITCNKVTNSDDVGIIKDTIVQWNETYFKPFAARDSLLH